MEVLEEVEAMIEIHLDSDDLTLPRHDLSQWFFFVLARRGKVVGLLVVFSAMFWFPVIIIFEVPEK